ncbi:NIPSNAP family protein [Arthrobacter globiformis]|uniref:NIPSNAP domain-containing protein n=1 Tax=Arthrobacter globiformis TaxID=1665 RepID=A0A328HDU2_ARTGO|nr:NIPSNAP family protein [Arthrobacter globiformis]RAM36737.1 hypothetical protein DBZ45_13965 [Arthrobacter globiformis]
MRFELRTYDIIAGGMQDWLTLFAGKVVPMHEKFGMPVRAAWVDEGRSQFIWVREFIGSGTLAEQEARYRASPERAEVIGDEPRKFILNMQVQVVAKAFPG